MNYLFKLQCYHEHVFGEIIHNKYRFILLFIKLIQDPIFLYFTLTLTSIIAIFHWPSRIFGNSINRHSPRPDLHVRIV